MELIYISSWGYNETGQLGPSPDLHVLAPVQIAPFNGIIAAEGGQNHTVILKNDGTVWTIGSNFYGQLGDSTNNNSSLPIMVETGLTGVVAIAAGREFSLALKSDGTVWGWGWNYNGELGDSTTVTSTWPVKMKGISNAVAITAGQFHSLILLADGTVMAAGDNLYGTLGDGTYDDHNVPVPVPGISGVVDMVAGEFHSAVLKNDGTVWGWGHNGTGALGNGNFVDSNVPVQVTGLCPIITAITTEQEDGHAVLFPNPVESELKISINNPDDKVRVIIYDITGRTISDEITSGNNLILNTSGFPGGLYLVSVKGERTNYSGRFVKN